jgi:acyl carrier protein
MNNDVYVQLAEVLEVDKVSSDDVLTDFPEWDSLTVLSLIAMLDAQYGLNITATELSEFKTAGEIARLVEAAELKKRNV